MRARPFLIVLLCLALLAVAGCGSDDEKKDDDSQRAPASLNLPPLAEQDKGDEKGAVAHSDAPSKGKPVVECSAINREGRTAAVPFNGFHDISIRGIDCQEAGDLIEQTYETWNGKAVAADVGGYACTLLYTDDVAATVRCAKGDDSYRFTFQRAKKKAYRVHVRECGTFNRYYDITSRDLTCQAAAGVIADGASRWSGLGQRPLEVVGYRCRVLYTEGRHRTIRCTAGKRRSVRFSVATKPSVSHPRKPPVKEDAAVKVVPQKPEEPASTGAGLSVNVVTPCPPNGPWQAITAKGVSCDIVDTNLARGGARLTGLARGKKLTVGSFTCSRIDTGSQVPTVRCKAAGGVAFRASLVGASPASGTTTTTGTATAPAPAQTTTTP